MSFNIDEYFSELNTGNVLLSFKGGITSEVINTLLETIEAKLLELNTDNKIIKKVYNVLVESMQNLYHHIEDIPEDLRSRYDTKFGIVIVKFEQQKIIISIGNFVLSNKIKLLKDKLDKINSLSEEELKEMYKFILNHQKLSAKGGGGLGLVDIARKTGHKLEYTFQNYNNDYYFFMLNTIVN
jgi:hypothetical protein